MTWAFNDLKANKGIWAGVLLVLTVTQTILCATGVSMGVNDYYLGVPGKTGEAAKHLGSGLALVYAVAVVLGCLVIMLTLQASIRQRRQGLALLSLLGATPRQVLAFTVTQVFALTMMASVIGLALSPLLAPPILQFHSAVLGLPPVLTFTWHNFTRSALTGLAAGLITALLGAFLTLRDLRTMIPVQLLNRAGAEESMTKAKSSKGKLLFLSAMIVLLLPLAGNVYLSQHGLAAMSSEQIMTVISLTGNGSLLAIILILVALTRSGGSAIGWSTRVWTRLIPARSPAWKIARSQAITRSRGKAFGSSVISLTACLFLVGGLLAAGQTSTAGMRSLPQLRGLSSASPMELLAGFWAALLITLVGAVASFAISAKERNLDLALVSIAGADRRQLLAISALDGFILMTTGVLVAAVATLVVGAATAIAFLPLSGSFHMVFPGQFLLALGVPIITIGSFATLFSARSTLQKPAIATIQAAIGE
ncbi:MAG: FtsX-like permease family protein [Bifidobacterium tibiigranuli]|jgi:putative ABC transport system permease protein|uniref:FtsX-like permease family protein n=1 Tax=Bifidobacterium tibiigranuli TaxID=2172043 RepID=UPI0023546F13|nr:FtsX-like permease family protein [Bifidobacterium tibiigranuli]MCH3974306.1 FtsX-like permease family protein [Bifidobacterium tibiigranuli]MCH4188869.1 FtsX-like permease family protein [Bifidobacterium tibiigranuli]MCH4203226.1 FtsX-like permease family protein [Bifidobacterium tibiigranuli]MCH4273459.1 FtsX-like permease family protein [Bifidobacterium tibiigranuli]MCI1253628.1 FtsX-like permease family protein [Bifidobacterium tibiigranuli]